MKSKTLALTCALLCTTSACRPPTADEASGAAAGHSPDEPVSSADEHASNRIAIPETVRRNLGITFARVEARHVEQTLRVPGAFELQPLARREYGLALAGRVDLRVDQNERVEAGQLLFRYQSPQWPELLHEIIEGEQAINAARAAIEVGQARLDEAQGLLALVRRRLAALAEAEFKKADLETEAAVLEASLPRLEAELRAAQTQLINAGFTREHALHRAAIASGIPEAALIETALVNGEPVPRYRTIDWIEVRAETAGIVERLYVTEGSFADAAGSVLSTVEPQRVRFRALALQSDLPSLARVSDGLIVPPESQGLQRARVEVMPSVPASVELGLEAHPGERTLTLLATPRESAAWIRPGVSAFLELVVDQSEAPTLAIPRSSIVQDGVRHVFFRRDPQDPTQVLCVEADLGVDDGRWVVVHSGVMLADEIVLEGAYELKLAMQPGASSQPGGHVHADGSFHAEN